MIVLNTTFYVHESIDESFRQWIKKDYLPSAISDGKLTNPSIARLLVEPQEGMIGYAIQVMSTDIDIAKSWHDNTAADLRARLGNRFGQKVLFFTTYMESLSI